MDIVQQLGLLDPNTQWVLIGMILICSSSAVIGTFTFLRKRALVGDAISHAILPGVCLAFLFTQTKHPLVLFIGAVVSGWLGLLSINAITKYTRIKSDAALALVLSIFYGIGIVFLTLIQQSGNASQSGLDKFLFGKAAAILPQDVWVYLGFSIVLGLAVFLLYPWIKLVIFDRDFALAKEIPVQQIELLLSLLTVCAIALGIQAVGVVLMSALLIAPAAAARYWTHKLKDMLILASLFAIASGILGALISGTYPKFPTGPWVVSVLSLTAILSVFLGKRKGVLARYRKKKRNEHKMLRENILKCFFHLSEYDHQPYKARTEDELMERRGWTQKQLMRGLKSLTRDKWVQSKGGLWEITSKGFQEATRIVRIHRLWELYLTKYMQLPADHVHEDAEAIEHIITPEIEHQLLRILKNPDVDPHESRIPYGLQSSANGVPLDKKYP